MFKKISAALLAFAILLSLCGCTKESMSTIMSVKHDTKNSLAMDYKKFSGYRETDVIVKENQTAIFNVATTTKGGTLDIKITEKSGETVFDKKNVPTAEYNIRDIKPGEYVIRIDGKEHSGSHEIIWNIK